MTQQEVGWFCVALGAFYTVGLSAFPSFFNTWLLCPRWGIFGPPASRFSGIGGGLTMLSLGLVHLNAAYSTAPAWLPWTFVVVSALAMVTGIARDPFIQGRSLTIHSSLNRVAVRLNSGVRPQGGNMRDIDAIISQLRLAHPDISAEQLAVLHPGADDDGLWFFRHPASDVQLQLESSTGNCPFLVESSATADRFMADTAVEAVTLVVTGLGLTGQRPNNSFKPKPLRGSA